MSTSVLLAFAASLTTALPAAQANPFEQALVQPSSGYVSPGDIVYRGQNPMVSGQVAASAPLTVPPPQGSTTYYPPTYTDPNGAVVGGGTVVQPFGDPNYPSAITQDPWLGGAVQPAAPMAPTYGYGVFGPQPTRVGWETRIDVGWIPKASTSSPEIGDMEVLEVDLEAEYSNPTLAGWVFSTTPQFNYRSIQGPQGDPTRDLPGSLYRFGLDLALQTTSPHGCTFEFGFTPGIATDFAHSIGSDAIQLDGRAVAYWRTSQQWMWVLGATYWDRVDDIVLPYAGGVWTPNDRWEFRLIFPKPRISLFLGTPNGVPTWMYAEAEYNVESYEIGIDPMLGDDTTKVQFNDIRVVGGFRWEAGWITTFIEGGYVFERQVDYAAPGAAFDVDDQFIGRIGFRY